MRDDTIFHHANMLNDLVRLEKFTAAMQSVIQKDHVVVDIGAGTGILSALARKFTNNNVYSIEYFADTLRLMQTMLESNKIANIHPMLGASYDICLNHVLPDVLISETIGLLGPEENIVEIFYDFCRRHQSIKHCIPAELSMYGQFLYSQEWDAELNTIKNKYASASLPNFDFAHIFAGIEDKIAFNIMQQDLSNSTIVAEPILLTKYILGKDAISDFSYKINVNQMRSASNILHLYFEAKLYDNVTLSSHLTHNVHWGHSFVPMHTRNDMLHLSYKRGSGVVNVDWKRD